MTGMLGFTPNRASSRSTEPEARPVGLVSLRVAISGPLALGVGLGGVADQDDGALGPRHRSLDQQQVAFGVGLDDGEVEGGGPPAAGSARHAGAPEDPRGRGRPADRAGGAVHAVGAVAGAEATEPVALHDPRASLALADGGDVDKLALRQQVDADLLAHLVVTDVVEAQLDQLDPGLDPRTLELAGDGLGQLGSLLLSEGHLERAVPVALVRLDLDHAARPHAQDRDRDDVVVVVPDLRHADLLADDRSCGHGVRVFLWLVTRPLRSGIPRRSASVGCAARFPATRACTDVSWDGTCLARAGRQPCTGPNKYSHVLVRGPTWASGPRTRFRRAGAARAGSLRAHGFRTMEARRHQEPRPLRPPGRRAPRRRVGRTLVPGARRRPRARRRGWDLLQPARRGSRLAPAGSGPGRSPARPAAASLPGRSVRHAGGTQGVSHHDR